MNRVGGTGYFEVDEVAVGVVVSMTESDVRWHDRVIFQIQRHSEEKKIRNSKPTHSTWHGQKGNKRERKNNKGEEKE